MDAYRYNDAWKASVDRCGEEWRAYCEAVSVLKRFFQNQVLRGRRLAVLDYETALQLKREKHGQQGDALAARLRSDFLLIGTHEGERIEKEAVSQLEQYRPAA